MGFGIGKDSLFVLWAVIKRNKLCIEHFIQFRYNQAIIV